MYRNEHVDLQFIASSRYEADRNQEKKCRDDMEVTNVTSLLMTFAPRDPVEHSTIRSFSARIVHKDKFVYSVGGYTHGKKILEISRQGR
jgi:hypothetical protein